MKCCLVTKELGPLESSFLGILRDHPTFLCLSLELDISSLLCLQKTVYGANVIVFEGILSFANKELLQVMSWPKKWKLGGCGGEVLLWLGWLVSQMPVLELVRLGEGSTTAP